jgi:hypothetical protein
LCGIHRVEGCGDRADKSLAPPLSVMVECAHQATLKGDMTMQKEHLEIILENIDSKFQLVLESQGPLDRNFRACDRNSPNVLNWSM